MEKIDVVQSGIEAARRREVEFHPKDPTTGKPLSAWDKRSHTLQLAIWNINELIDVSNLQATATARLADRVSVLEAKPAVPFPGSGP